MNLGDYTRQLREQSGITQDELITRIEISRATYWKLETKGEAQFGILKDVFKRGLNATETQWATALTLWLRELLGGDFNLIEQGSESLRSEEDAPTEKFTSEFTLLPVEDQEQVKKAIERPEVLKALKSINTLYDGLAKNP